MIIKQKKETIKPISSVKIGMKLEAVDIYNPTLIRVATVSDVDLSNNKLMIHYDMWSDIYNVWFDYESEDLHPINWCKVTNYPLSIPTLKSSFKNLQNTCPTIGCTGFGHAKGYKFISHYR